MKRLSAGADLLDKPTYGFSLFRRAARSGRPEILDLFLGLIKAAGRLDDDEVKRCLELAVEDEGPAFISQFLAYGVDPSAGLNGTAYTYDLPMLRFLLDHGADIHKLTNIWPDDGYVRGDSDDEPLEVLDSSGQLAMPPYIDWILNAGWSVDDLHAGTDRQIRFITGAWRIPAQDVQADGFTTPSNQFFGDANPMEATAPYHLEMLRTGKCSFWMREDHAPDLPKPAWTAQRFGQSTTRLPDGGWVKIGGEHEDYYMEDFIIFNDVIVHDAAGNTRVLFYPEAVFPPTDFHSATLVGDYIWIIGNLGHPPQRRPGETPVYRLSLSDFSITRVETSGPGPGWISRHSAHAEGAEITVSGGNIGTEKGYPKTDDAFVLDTSTKTWRRMRGIARLQSV